jgi:hypothetical protein
MVGVIGIWSTVNGMFLATTLKQRAVFALDSQTDRLTAIYRNCNGFDGNSGRYTDAAGCTAAPAFAFVKTQAADFTNGVATDAEKVFYASANGYNDIFIDRQKLITARLSWRKNADSPACCSLIAGGAPCATFFSANGAVCLEVSIKYPYRWNAAAGGSAKDDSLGADPDVLPALTALTITGINPWP